MLGTGVRELGRRSLRLLASLEARPAAPCSTLEPPVTLAVARGFACRSCTAPTLTGAFRGVTRGWAAAAGLLACRGFRAAAAARDVRAASGGDAGEGASPTPAWLPDGAVPSPLPKERSLLEEVQGMSRKRQQFHLTQLLKGRSSLRVEKSDDDDGGSEPGERALQMQVIDVNRTVKVTKGGSLQRFSALVVVGNGDGVVGWALGKAPEVAAAIDKAYARASRSLFFFERFEGHTIFHDTRAKFGRSLVQIAPLPSGSGLKANDTIAAVCRLAGIKDIRAKVIGSHNPNTTLRAVFEALDAVRSPSEVAAMRGRTVIRTNG